MNEIDNGPLTNAELGRAAVGGILKMLAIKWAIIFVITRSLKRAVEKS